VRKFYILLFLLFLASCAEEHTEPAPDYGEEYFQMECVWRDPNNNNIVWECSEQVKTDLVSGYLKLQLSGDTELYFCGEKLVLQSGVTIYDNLVSYLTRNELECLRITEDKQKGNQFDWTWNRKDRLLQAIWRPEDEPHKMISLVIEDGKYDQIVSGIVYYKTL